MIKQLLKLFKQEYKTLNRIELSENNLIHNYLYLKSLIQEVAIAPVLKSNAYGHGLIEIAKILDHLNAPFFCVDSLYEAYELIKAGIKTPVLIMGYTNPDNLKVKKLPFSYTVYDLDTAQVLNKFQPGSEIHLKIDTGMSRLGIRLEDLENFLTELKKLPHLKVEGLMSHLASTQDNTLLQKQIENFKKAQEILKKFNFHPKWQHLSASSGLLNPKARDAILKISNLARPGLALYGISDSDNSQLKPVLKLTSHLAQIKTLGKGDRVGYDGTYVTAKDTVVGILPIGYYDGVDRRLSNNGAVTIGGIKCPIIGRVSMNITAVDISKVKKPSINQEVIIYSDDPQDVNSVKNSADNCQTIPYDLLVHLASSTKRVIV